jgi:hypothetical protein
MAGGLLGVLGLPALTKASKPPVAATPSVAPVPSAASTPSVGAAPNASTPPVDKNLVAFQAARKPVAQLVDTLKADPQAGHLGPQIGQAQAKLAAADAAAGGAQWKDAAARLGECRAICVAAQKLAREWADYAAKRAVANALVYALKNSDKPTEFVKRQAELSGADVLAGQTPPKFAAALRELQKIDAATLPDVKGLVAGARARLKECEAAGAKSREFIKDDIAQATPLVVAAEAARKAGEYAKAMQGALAAYDIVGPAHRMIARRDGYEKQRTTTVAMVAKVRGQAAVQGRAAALDTMVADADKLAARDSMRVEEGTGVLVDAYGRGDRLVKLAPVIAASATERTAAEKEIAKLDQDPAAARIAKERAAIRALLAGAGTQSTQADAAADPTPGWNGALATLKQARADIALATKLAASFGPAAAAEAAAANTGDPKAMQAALVKLRADGKAAAKAPNAAAADTEFKRFEQRAGDAEKALAGNDAKTAATAMLDAAQALVAARTIQAEHAQLASTQARVEASLKKLQASPRAAGIKARIDAVTLALGDAKAKDQAHDGPGAMAAIRRASDAEAAAQAADAKREKFDAAAATFAKKIAPIKDAAAKKALDDLVTAARKTADTLDFAAADKALDQVEVALDKRELQSKLTAKPDEKGIAALADKMTKKGGGAEVDAMIQKVPDGGDPRLVNAMATGRFGMKFSTGKPLVPAADNTIQHSGDEAKSMKRVCEMFAKIPEDIRGNPSITSVRHEDAEKSAGGGYQPDDGSIEMDGRKDEVKQRFGSKQKQHDPKTNTNVMQLPAVDPKCTPVNEDEIDFLSFAAAHEVGHGVDDKLGFMQKHQSGPDYGGWVVFGSSVEPLANIVAAHFHLDNKPENRRYVLDMIQSKPPTRPTPPVGDADIAALDAFDKWHDVATTKNVYRRQSDCEFIHIGDYVYHEAYRRNWVGYHLAARTKGLTGYQFRAPGEWFAELYAGFRSKKLQPDHPAMIWLKTL